MTVLAHAFGARYDLPVPLTLFVMGGGVVVLISFAMSGRRPVRAPREQVEPPPVNVVPSAPLHTVFTPISLLCWGFLVWAGLIGSQEVAENMLPTAFWLLTWIVAPLSCGIAGDWTRPVNPFGALARLADRPQLRKVVLGSPEPLRWPARLAWWPAVGLFFLAACGELVFNLTMTVPRNTALALIVYALVSSFCGLVFGPAWVRRGELFSVLFSTWGRLGYFRFDSPGSRGFAGGLKARFDRSASRIAFVLLLLVSVNFDGLLSTPSWNRLEERMPGALLTHAARLETFRTLTFVTLTLLVALVFGTFAVASARVASRREGIATDLANLLPSLVPIAFGYLLVHNMQYVLVNGQLMAPLIGDPVGEAWWPLHLPYPFNDDYEVHTKFLPSAFYWYAGVAVIVAVHVFAVVIAHHRLAAPVEKRVTERRHEYPWLTAMVGYTMVSLWLIAQPLVTEKPGTPPKPAADATATTSVVT